MIYKIIYEFGSVGSQELDFDDDHSTMSIVGQQMPFDPGDFQDAARYFGRDIMSSLIQQRMR
ncbi:MAG: hypothetical protein LBB23_03340 [Rickettsiales bacterium]|jgi:hypothetical protein|nr:hypothetical protein [Rickettsiales bacterium]